MAAAPVTLSTLIKPVVEKTVTIHSKPRVGNGKVWWASGLSEGSLLDAVPSGRWGWSQSGQTHSVGLDRR